MAFFKNTFGGATTTSTTPTPNSGGFFSGVFSSNERRAVSDLNITKASTTTAKSTPQTVNKRSVPTSSIGGTVGFLGDILSTGQHLAMSTLQTVAGLEKDKSFGQKFSANPTGKDVLRQLGEKSKPSSTVGKLVTGTYEPSESVVKNFFKELPSTVLGTAGDIILDPLTFLSGFGLVKKGTTAVKESVVKPAINALEKTATGAKVVNKTGEWLVPRYGQPELFKSLDRARLAEEQMIASNVDTLVGPILKQNAEIQTKIADAIKGQLTDDARVKAFAEPIRAELDRVGAEISKVNPALLDPKTFEGNKGTYFPRMFEKYEIDDQTKQIESFFSTGTRAPKDRFMARKDLPDEVLESLGEIKTAGYPSAKGLTQLQQAETRSKFFKEVSDNFASDVPSGNLVQLPDSKYLGALSGKFVLPSIAEVVNGTVKTTNPALQKYLDALSLWKTFKTAYNPATVSRNVLTNTFVLNPLGGVPFWDINTYAKATKEMLNPGPIYNAARKAGLDISNQNAAELMTKASTLYTKKKSLFGQFFPKVQDFHKAVTNFYGNTDKFFKLANIIKGLDNGLNMQQALNRANFYLIDYSEVPKAVDFLRKSFVPFISFTYGVSKPLAKTLLERPDKLANYFKVLREIQQMNPYQETQDEKLREYDALPQYIKEGNFERLPIKDATDRTQYLDLQYILPFNPVETKSLSPSNPFFEVVSDLKRNKSGFTGKAIWEETDTQGEKNLKALKYVWLQMSPNNPLIPKSWSFNKLQDVGIFPRVDNGSLVIEPRPDSLGRERSKITAILDSLFGIKLTPIDVKTEEAKRAIEKKGTINDLKSQLFKLMLNKQMLPADKEEQKQNLLDKIKKATEPE